MKKTKVKLNTAKSNKSKRNNLTLLTKKTTSARKRKALQVHNDYEVLCVGLGWVVILSVLVVIE